MTSSRVAFLVCLAASSAAFGQTRVGPGLDFGDGSSMGIGSAGRARLRYNNSSHVFEQSLNGGAYTTFGGAAFYQTIQKDVSGLPVDMTQRAKIYFGPSFNLTDNASYTKIDVGPNADLVVSNGDATHRWITVYTPVVQDSTTVVMKSSAADGASAVAAAVDTTSAWSNLTAKILDIRDNGASKGSFKFHPVSSTLFGWQGAGDTFFLDNNQNGFTIQGGVTFFYANNGTAYVAAGQAKLYPQTDVQSTLGDSTHRWLSSYVGTDSVGTAQTSAMFLKNGTAAGAGAQQYSPMFEIEGQGWKTNATAGSQSVKWGIQNRPIQGTANPDTDLVFWQNINGAGWAETWKLGSFGTNLPRLYNANNTGLWANGSSAVQMVVNGTGIWNFGSTGLIPASDNTYTLGSTSTRVAGVFNSGAASCKYNLQTGTTYTATSADCIVAISNAAARTVTMPAANSVAAGGYLIISDANNNGGAQNVSVARAGSDTINGGTTNIAVVTANSAHSTCYSDGSSKWVCGVNN